MTPELATAKGSRAAGPTMRRLAGSAGVVAANGFNSASNFLLVVLLARALDATAFGAVSVVLTGLILAAVFLRGLVIEPLIAAGDHLGPRAAIPHVAAASAAISAAALAGALALGTTATVSAGLAIGAGATIVVDWCRWTLVQQSRQIRAASVDLVWLVAQVGAVAFISTSAGSAALSWALGGVLAAALAALSLDLGTSVEPRQRLEVRLAWGVENVVAASSAQLALVAVPLVAGFQATGSLRGASSLLGYTTVLLGAMHQVGLIRMTAAAARPREVAALATRLSIGVAVLVAISIAPLLVIDDPTGARLLGETWEGARAVLPWFVVQKVLAVLTFGATLVTRVLDLSSGLVRDRSILAVASVLAGLLGGATAGAQGAAVGISVVALATLIIWVRRVSGALSACAT